MKKASAALLCLSLLSFALPASANLDPKATPSGAISLSAANTFAQGAVLGEARFVNPFTNKDTVVVIGSRWRCSLPAGGTCSLRLPIGTYSALLFEVDGLTPLRADIVTIAP